MSQSDLPVTTLCSENVCAPGIVVAFVSALFVYFVLAA